MGRDSHKGIMILASAMRHSVGRPAHGNGGGLLPMERLPPAAGLSILTCTYQWTLRMIWLFASHRETQRWEKNMKPLETKQFPSEVITIDGCTVIMRYAEKPVPGVMDKVKGTLVNQNFLDKKYSISCKND